MSWGLTGARGTGQDLWDSSGVRLNARRDSGIHWDGDGARRRRFGAGSFNTRGIRGAGGGGGGGCNWADVVEEFDVFDEVGEIVPTRVRLFLLALSTPL